MIKRVQVLWYLNKDDLENYCLDFKPYKSHKLEGYEIYDVDEDLIYDLCDRDPDRLEPVGYFKNRKEVENYLTDYITNNEYDLEIGSPELNSKISDAINTIEFSEEGYYISVGDGEIGDSHILSDILNINEASLDSMIPNKGRISIEEWNEILDKMYKKNKLYLGLNRVI